MSRAVLRQGMSYGMIGVIVLLLDWLVFVASSAVGVATIPANLLGRVAGAALGFWSNGTFTFNDASGSRLGWRRLLRYVVTWLATAGLSTLAMYLIDRHAALGWAWLAKPFVDGLLAAVAFTVSRYWIYR